GRSQCLRPLRRQRMATEAARLVRETAVEDQPLGRDHLAEDPLAPKFEAVGGPQAIMEDASGLEIDRGMTDRESLGSPPLQQMLALRPNLEDPPARRIDGAAEGKNLRGR